MLCGKCGIDKAPEEFPKRAYSGEPTKPCKACRAEYMKAYRKTHLKEHREHNRRYRQTKKGKEASRRSALKYRASHLEERRRYERERQRRLRLEMKEQETEYEFTHIGLGDAWYAKCARCGKEYDGRVVKKHFVYCPNCGKFVSNRTKLKARG